jgi:hypothetical protein
MSSIEHDESSVGSDCGGGGLTRSQWGQRILFYVVFTPPPPSHHGVVRVCHLSIVSSRK